MAVAGRVLVGAPRRRVAVWTSRRIRASHLLPCAAPGHFAPLSIALLLHSKLYPMRASPCSPCHRAHHHPRELPSCLRDAQCSTTSSAPIRGSRGGPQRRHRSFSPFGARQSFSVDSAVPAAPKPSPGLREPSR